MLDMNNCIVMKNMCIWLISGSSGWILCQVFNDEYYFKFSADSESNVLHVQWK